MEGPSYQNKVIWPEDDFSRSGFNRSRAVKMKNLYFEPVLYYKRILERFLIPINSRWITKADLKLKYKRRLFA